MIKSSPNSQHSKDFQLDLETRPMNKHSATRVFFTLLTYCYAISILHQTTISKPQVYQFKTAKYTNHLTNALQLLTRTGKHNSQHNRVHNEVMQDCHSVSQPVQHTNLL